MEQDKMQALGDFSIKQRKRKKIATIVIFLIIFGIFAFWCGLQLFKWWDVLAEESVEKDRERCKETYIDCDCEKTFENPIDIVWTGKAIAKVDIQTFSVRRVPIDKEYPIFFACCLDEESIPNLEELVKVSGKWFGMTCACLNRLGCVPNVEIEKIEKID